MEMKSIDVASLPNIREVVYEDIDRAKENAMTESSAYGRVLHLDPQTE
jgi:hypothetical protein